MRLTQYRPFQYGTGYGSGPQTKERAERLLIFMQAYIQRTGGVPPSFREMQSAAGVSSISHVHRVLAHLENAGKIRRLPRQARAIELVQQAPRYAYFKFDDEAKELVPMWPANRLA